MSKGSTRCIKYKLTDDLKFVDVESVVAATDGTTEEQWAAMCETLPDTDCRYIIYDVTWQTADGGERSKILFVLWSPDSAKIKSKMLYTSSKDAFKKALVGIAQDFQATDKSEISFDVAIEKCKGATTDA